MFKQGPPEREAQELRGISGEESGLRHVPEQPKDVKMKKLLAVLCAALMAGAVFAHSGGTDSQGCHYDRKTGIRHCH